MDRKEKYEEIKRQVRIEDFAERYFGFSIVRKGKYLSLKEHDSVIIDPSRNCFWRNSKQGRGRSIGKGGSVIDFALEFSDMELPQVLKLLEEEVYGLEALPRFSKPAESDKKETTEGLQLPEKDSHMRNVFAYLIKTRKIMPEVVQDWVDRKYLYQDTHKNCVFVGYDLEHQEKPVFACRRGTNTEKPFFGDVEGCDYSQGVYFENKQATKLYVTESPIDAMSVMSLKGEERNQYSYLAMGGAWKEESLQKHLRDRGLQEICIGTDRDEAGEKGAEVIREMVRKQRPDIRVFRDRPETGKDWNEVLQKGKETSLEICMKNTEKRLPGQNPMRRQERGCER